MNTQVIHLAAAVLVATFLPVCGGSILENDAGHHPHHQHAHDEQVICNCTLKLDRLSCSNLTSNSLQKCLSDKCFQHSPTFFKCNESISIVKGIHSIRRFELTGSFIPSFFLSILQNMTSLRDVSLIDNNITEFCDYEELILPKVSSLNLSLNGLKNISGDFLASFPDLKYLNLANNSFTNLQSDLFGNSPHLQTVNLKNNKWFCHNMSWLINDVHANKFKLEDSTNSTCIYHNNDTSAGVPLMESCPRNCTCLPNRVGVIIDCSGQGYYALPLAIHHLTVMLHMENNYISNLALLLEAFNNETKEGGENNAANGGGGGSSAKNSNKSDYNLDSYRQLKQLYLDNNSFSSLNELEKLQGFLNKLAVLSVTGNKLTQVPLIVIKNINFDQLYLGSNPWDCDCDFFIPFNIFLNQNQKMIRDVNNITCSPDDPNYAGKPVAQLSKFDLCSTYTGIHHLDILNVSLALLILFFIAKLVYDYRQLKKTGKFPIGPYSVCHWFKKLQKKGQRYKDYS